MLFKQACAILSARSKKPGIGFEKLRVLLATLGNPQEKLNIIHVAGTNGKGSVCTLLAQSFSLAGHRTGLFISPHLNCPTERLSVDGEPISKRAFAHLVQQVQAVEKEPLNFFEFLTVMAFVYFEAQKVAYAVLETGLGGRKDPTNVCTPLASVITSIGLDHTQLLGKTLAQIAAEKAGIIKPRIPVFCGELPPIALRVVKRAAAQKKSPLTVVQQEQPFTLKAVSWAKQQLLLTDKKTVWRLALLGEKQTQNACLVYQIGQSFHLPQRALKNAFKTVRVPGRFEVITSGNTTFVLDGAHNPQAVENLVAFYRQTPFYPRANLLCGFMKDKDFNTMLKRLAPHFEHIILTVPPSPRGATKADFRKWLSNPKITCEPHLHTALKKAAQSSTVLCTGSFYLVGAVRQKLVQMK